MERNLAPFYLLASAANAGSSVLAAALVYALQDQGYRVGVFRPVTPQLPSSVVPGSEGDPVLQALVALSTTDLTVDECRGVTYNDVINDRDAALSTLIERFAIIQQRCDIVVILGSDYSSSLADEFDLNGQIAMNLGARVLLVHNVGDRDDATIRSLCTAAVRYLRLNYTSPVALLINRIPGVEADYQQRAQDIVESLSGLELPILTAPDVPLLHAPTFREIAVALNAEAVNTVDEEEYTEEVLSVVVAGVTARNILDHIHDGSVVVVPADRESTLTTLIENQHSPHTPNLAGIIWSTTIQPNPEQLALATTTSVPILTTHLGTYATATTIDATRGVLRPSAVNKLNTARDFASQWCGTVALENILTTPAPDIVTPLMFQHRLLQGAKADKKHIVLPEGDDDRILRAAASILAAGVADLTLLGDPDTMKARAAELGISIDGANLLDPTTYPERERFAETYYEMRKHKGISLEDAREKMLDISYFATMMIHLGLADGMVSGAAHTTAHTIRPSFEIIETKPGVSTVSSIFLMCLNDHVLAFGDCAVVINPTAQQLADIALSSAETAKQFGVDPKVALLSYSTGSSGAGADVDKVREAVVIATATNTSYPIDGPLQFDAAVDKTVGASKAPNSLVAGQATVLVFPDLNTGNNTYKAVQRTAGAVAVGPILQGLNKPINDLSRGALVEDIVNTVAVTATQAQIVQE